MERLLTIEVDGPLLSDIILSCKRREKAVVRVKIVSPVDVLCVTASKGWVEDTTSSEKIYTVLIEKLFKFILLTSECCLSHVGR